MLYLITYDLNKPGQDYQALHEEIKSIGAWWHYLDSTWLVKSSLGIEAMQKKIKARVDNSDHFLIVDITNDRTQGWLPEKAWDWINANRDG